MSSWKDELHTAAALGGWPEANASQAETAIASLPDSTDWNPPGTFWTSAAMVVGQKIGALPGATALIDTWAQRGAARGHTWTDTAGDVVDNLASGAAKAATASAEIGVAIASAPLTQIKGAADAGAVIATKGAEAVDKSVDLVNKTNNTARMIGIPLVILLGAAYFGFGRK